MPNQDTPFGLRAVRHRNGAPYSGSGSLYHVASGDSQVIAPGDPVVITGEADANGIPTVTRATAGDSNRITGVMIGLTNGDGDGVLQDSGLNTQPSTSQYILVEDNPDVVFEAQCSGTLTAAQIGLNANLAAAAPIEGKSQWEVANGSAAATATFQVKILRLVRRVDNEVGEFAKVEVMINQHTQTAGTAGI